MIVKNGQVIAHAVNQITATNDPTAHAELLALREAGKVLGRAKLDDCVVYASGQPCPLATPRGYLLGGRGGGRSGEQWPWIEAPLPLEG